MPSRKPAKATGRPSSFTPALAEEICARVIESDYGLEQICEAGDLPSARTVFRWLAAHDGFRQQYARAKEAQGHVQADRGLRDAIQATDAALGRLKFDARKWAAAKLAPKQYGDKLAHVGGDEGDAPIRASVDVSGLNQDQLRALASVRLPADS